MNTDMTQIAQIIDEYPASVPENKRPCPFCRKNLHPIEIIVPTHPER